MKNLSDSELKSGCILDLTDDPNLIRRAMEYGDELSDAEVIGEVSSIETQYGKMISLFSFAEATGDNELLERLNNLFATEMASLFNE